MKKRKIRRVLEGREREREHRREELNEGQQAEVLFTYNLVKQSVADYIKAKEQKPNLFFFFSRNKLCL